MVLAGCSEGNRQAGDVTSAEAYGRRVPVKRQVSDKIGGMREFHVREARVPDCEWLARMRAKLWPDGTVEEHRRELKDLLAGEALSTLPTVVLVAESSDGSSGDGPSGDGLIWGFLEAGLRSHADGCDTRRPVGFIEGWFVEKKARRQGVGRALVVAAEAWARSHGCTEMASDTWIEDEGSQFAHRALGYEETDRCVHYRKTL